MNIESISSNSYWHLCKQTIVFIYFWLHFNVFFDMYLHIISLDYFSLILTYCVLSVHKQYLFQLKTLKPEIEGNLTYYFSSLTRWSIRARCHHNTMRAIYLSDVLKSVKNLYIARTGFKQTCPSNVFIFYDFVTLFHHRTVALTSLESHFCTLRG